MNTPENDCTQTYEVGGDLDEETRYVYEEMKFVGLRYGLFNAGAEMPLAHYAQVAVQALRHRDAGGCA